MSKNKEEFRKKKHRKLNDLFRKFKISRTKVQSTGNGQINN